MPDPLVIQVRDAFSALMVAQGVVSEVYLWPSEPRELAAYPALFVRVARVRMATVGAGGSAGASGSIRREVTIECSAYAERIAGSDDDAEAEAHGLIADVEAAIAANPQLGLAAVIDAPTPSEIVASALPVMHESDIYGVGQAWTFTVVSQYGRPRG